MIKKLTIIAAAACAMCAAHSAEIKFDENSEIFENPGHLNVSGTAGVRFTLNISYPLQVYAGAEYTYGYLTTDWEKDLNDMIMKPIGINMKSNFGLYAGLKWCF